MSVLGTDLPNLLDLQKSWDPDGAIATVVEALTKRNPVLEDMVVKEGNLPTGHRVTSRTGLPSVGWRRYNEGVSPSKSRRGQYDESCGQLEGFSAVDVKLARLGGNEAAFRASEDVAFVQALNNELSTGVFYHSTKTSPEKFMGIAPRLDSTTGAWGGQIVIGDAAAAGNDQTSIHLVCWGPEAVFGTFPKGSQGGIEPDDMGKQLWDDGSGKKYRAWVTHWSWDFGLVVQDARQLVRIANVDMSAIKADESAGTKLVDTMIDAYYRIFDPSGGRLAFYCGRQVATFLHKQAKNAVKNSTLSISEIAGRPITTVLGIPVRMTDALNVTESVIT